ncbi:MAG: hypothetical protein U0893_16545 [Chloroflexota bacterium]
MRDKLNWVARGLALLSLVVGLALPSAGYAGKGDEDDKDHKGQKEEEQTDRARSNKEDHQTSGQVLEINTLADPPLMWIANRDGVVKVRMLTTDLIAKNGVRLGDHVTVIGEKISEVEFDCQDMTIDARFGESDNESN